MCENLRRLNVDPVVVAFATHVHEKRQKQNVVLPKLLGGKITGAVGSASFMSKYLEMIVIIRIIHALTRDCNLDNTGRNDIIDFEPPQCGSA